MREGGILGENSSELAGPVRAPREEIHRRLFLYLLLWSAARLQLDKLHRRPSEATSEQVNLLPGEVPWSSLLGKMPLQARTTFLMPQNVLKLCA